jgi:opacity protein-like surface antigen
MTIKRIVWPTVAALSLLASVALADQTPQQPVKTPESGWYGKVGFGASYYSSLFDDSRPASYAQLLGFGYQFNPHFALGVDILGLAKSTYIDVPVNLYAKGIIPLSDRWNLYGKVGLGGVVFASYSKKHYNRDVIDGWAFLSLGLGANYQLTRSLAIGAEASVHYGGFLAGLVTTANLTYFFNA